MEMAKGLEEKACEERLGAGGMISWRKVRLTLVGPFQLRRFHDIKLLWAG